MGADQIGNKPLSFELFSCAGTALSADDLGFRLHHQRMHTLGVASIEAVTEMVEALWNATTTIKVIDAKGHQLVLPLLGQTLNDVDVLPWEVLMNEKDSH